MTDLELNEAVARELGWYEEMLPSYISPWTGKECGLKSTLRNPKTGNSDLIPDYCHSIEAAFEILEHLRKEWDYVLEYQHKDYFSFGIYKQNNRGYVSKESADTAPRAICEAFLKLP